MKKFLFVTATFFLTSLLASTQHSDIEEKPTKIANQTLKFSIENQVYHLVGYSLELKLNSDSNTVFQKAYLLTNNGKGSAISNDITINRKQLCINPISALCIKLFFNTKDSLKSYIWQAHDFSIEGVGEIKAVLFREKHPKNFSLEVYRFPIAKA
jgi:hypothetical protein